MLTRKIMGSLGVLGAAASVAGLGTFGTFNDSTSVSTAVQDGTVSVNLAVPGGAKAIPVTTSGFLPSDSLSRQVNLSNDGDTMLASVSLSTTAAPSSALVTDQVNGLRLTVQSCSKAWTETDTAAGAPTFTCGGTQNTLYSGPAVTTTALTNPASLTPGGTDKIVFTLSLPTTAGNTEQNLSATLNLSFVGVQRGAASR
ncbi:MAG: uncharacterized protein JWO98_4594 [Frankiales bacterium]|nr:uncharacterized protein [Frankiales bacterium]